MRRSGLRARRGFAGPRCSRLSASVAFLGGWYIGEMQAGNGTMALLLSDPVTAADHRIWAWSSIAAVDEARFAWNDERGFAARVIPGGLHEVFGVRGKDVWMRPAVELRLTDAGPPADGRRGERNAARQPQRQHRDGEGGVGAGARDDRR